MLRVAGARACSRAAAAARSQHRIIPLPHLMSAAPARPAPCRLLLVMRHHRCFFSHGRQLLHNHGDDNKKPTSGAGHSTSSVASDPSKDTELGQIKPMMQIGFTCNKCKTRVFKTFSKHAYTKGIVIITCPGCKAHHLIADNLGWFSHFDGKNIEDFLAQKGQNVKRLQPGADGTIDIDPADIVGLDGLREIDLKFGGESKADGVEVDVKLGGEAAKGETTPEGTGGPGKGA